MLERSIALRTDELDYQLPPERIATRPAEPRDAARMLVVWRSDPGRLEHRHVRDLLEYLRRGDALVFNTTAVLPARFLARRVGTGGRIEGLFIDEAEAPDGRDPGARLWRVMLKAGGRLAPGDAIELLDHHGQPGGVRLTLVQREAEAWLAQPAKGASAATDLARLGWTPLPPYIRRARAAGGIDAETAGALDESDRHWYETVYADPGRRRSVAAPTAGLHFTPGLLDRLAREGVRRIDLTLHVGPGTFKPVTATTLAEHRMHGEWFEIEADALAALQAMRATPPSPARSERGRVIAVGTTSVRALESIPWESLRRGDGGDEGQIWGGFSGMTDLLIAPPHRFQLVQGMLTNFHLPRSTLLALVAAMLDEGGRGGLDRVKALYREAIAQGYRFYSYGDAMLILP